MPTREPELYKDKIEVSLDGRQIFYLFFGGAVIVGLVFVLGVMVGRRVEARGGGPPPRARPRPPAPPGTEPPPDVDRASGELDKRRAAARPDPKAARPEVKLDAKLDGKLE